MDNKVPIFSDKPYDGFDNETIKTLQRQRFDLNNQIRLIDEQINEIRSNCKHNFKFVCRSMYEDLYKCTKCGEEYEK